uniref:Uncharacterized protein n=1 Tax=viral metagenome TaxID=1070528 RepID=A0A6M3KNE5_9ZZZZ
MGILSDLFGGGDDGSKAADKANQELQQYLQEAMGQLQSSQAQGRGDLVNYLNQALGYGQQYRDAGAQGMQSYLGSLGLLGGAAQQKAYQQFTQAPGYQYALQQAQLGAQRGMAARGLGGSGAEQLALQQQAQGMAQQGYGQWQQQLAGLGSMGAQQAGQAAQMAYGTGGNLAQLGLGYGSDIANLYGQMGQSAAESTMAGAAADASQQSGLFSGIGSLVGGFFGIPGVQKKISSWL